jgi:hypothetical protein
MFYRATRGQASPTYLSTDHDPRYRFHQWQANLRTLDVREMKMVPYVPLSHPFVERLIGSIRRERLDCTLFWTATDLEMKLLISSATITAIERLRDWTVARRNRALWPAVPARMATRIDGSRTVAGCIRRRWRRDACSTDVPGPRPNLGPC